MGHEEIVKILLDAGAAVDSADLVRLSCNSRELKTFKKLVYNLNELKWKLNFE